VRIEILDDAELDLSDGFYFYEGQEAGLGWYFLDSLFSDVDSLHLYAGIHEMVYGYYRCLAVDGEIVRVHAVLGLPSQPIVDSNKSNEAQRIGIMPGRTRNLGMMGVSD
jgi:hypothetical protein